MMTSRFRILLTSVALLLAACESAPTVPGASGPDSGGPITSSAPARLHIELYKIPVGSPVFAGMSLTAVVSAFDSSGRRVDQKDLAVRLSDPSAARLTVSTNAFAIGRPDRNAYLLLDRPGAFAIIASLGQVADTVDVVVEPDPPVSSAVRVDAFEVYQYPMPCDWSCSYLAYAPVFRISEATGARSSTLHGVEFLLAGARSGLCLERATLQPGETREYGGVGPDALARNLLIVRADGFPLAGDTAVARLIVREADGAYGRVEARGLVRRVNSAADVPGTRSTPWFC